MTDTVTQTDGRKTGYTDYGDKGQTAVLWCHGGPGSRLEPAGLEQSARAQGLRIIGIDRPGYGASTAALGRSIASWVPDALAVADCLGIDRFIVVGVSTGGAYALAMAAALPRVMAVIACCALTDMRWAEGKAMMAAGAGLLWNAPDRASALRLAEESFGHDGSKMMSAAGGALPPADAALFADPAWIAGFGESMKAMFAQGLAGYVDDRLADGPGWGSFDVGAIRCPVTVLHGGADTIVPVAQAHYTASIVPGARLRIVEPLGHFSIVSDVIPAILDLGIR